MNQKHDIKNMLSCILNISEKIMENCPPFDNIEICENFMHWDYVQYITNTSIDKSMRTEIGNMLCDKLKYNFDVMFFLEKRRFLDAYPKYKYISSYMENHWRENHIPKRIDVGINYISKDDIIEKSIPIFFNNGFYLFKKSPISFYYVNNKNIFASLYKHTKGGFVSCKICIKDLNIIFDIANLYGKTQSRFWESDRESIRSLFETGIPTQIKIAKEIYSFYIKTIHKCVQSVQR